jgi:hypothetical protein
MLRKALTSGRWPAVLLYAGALGRGPAWHGSASADERLFIYPAAGQSQAQLADDRFACHERAVGESGFDPTRAAFTSRAQPTQVTVKVPPNKSEGATGHGMITGAVAGAVIGAVAGDHAGEGAVAGAAVGSILGNSVERQGAEAAEAQARAKGEQQLKVQEAEAAKLADQRARYRAAFSQCLTERGYTVR